MEHHLGVGSKAAVNTSVTETQALDFFSVAEGAGENECRTRLEKNQSGLNTL